MAVSFAGFSSKALCWRSVVAEKVSHAAKPTKSAIHTEASPVAAAAIFIPNASPMAVTLFAIRSWIMFLFWAALDRSGGLFVQPLPVCSEKAVLIPGKRVDHTRREREDDTEPIDLHCVSPDCLTTD